MATERQKKAVQRIVENGGIVSKAMEDVGYTKKTAKTPQKLTESKGYKEAAKPLVERLEIERDRSISALAGKIGKAKYVELITGLDKITKNIQLLSGKATENVNYIDITYDKAKSIIGRRKASD